MSRVTVPQTNFSGGELSQSLAGRFDLGIYYNGASWLQNFIATVQGMARYRSGAKFVWTTRDNALAVLIPFEYNTEQTYVLEFTNLKMRIVKDGGLVTLTPKTINSITNANPAVVDVTAHGYSNGDRVILSNIGGMIEANNKEYTVANVTADTYELQGINSSGWGTFTAGTSAKIVEVTTPYTTAQLFDLDYSQTNDTMYIVHPSHAPAKLTRSSHTSWTLANTVFIANPFGKTKAGAPKTITAATMANPVVISSAAHGYSNGEVVYIEGILGMTQLNKRSFTVQNVAAGTYELQGVDGTAYTAYTSGGTADKWTEFSYPSKLTFFEKRVIYGASDFKPQTIWGSQGGEYDNFLTGTGATDSFEYTLSSGQANRIRWMAATEDFLAIGTAGSEFKAQGGTNEPITPTNVSIKPPSFYGSSDVKPIRLDNNIFYIQRDSVTTRTFEFDAIQDGFTSINRNLTADTILQGRYGMPDGARQMAFQAGSPSINWVVRNDGVLCGLTFEPREQVNGWHRHFAGGSLSTGKLFRPEYESVATIAQADAPNQVYTVVHRTVDGQDVRYIEYFADQPNIPRFNDYYTGEKEEDTEAYLQDLWEAQKRLWYVDAGIALDGTVDETGELSAVTVGTGRTFTAGAAVFDASMVGRQIWGKLGGRAQITAYTSSTVVTVKILKAFPASEIVMAAGDWYLTFSMVRGLEHLEGETVVALVDGGVVENLVVEDGSVDLVNQASYVIVGLRYLGIYQSMDIEGGGDNGPSATKSKSVSQVGIRFLNTLGCLVGTDLYKLDRVTFRSTANLTSRPPPLFTGVKIQGVRDSWQNEKYIYCVQDKPLPCNIQLLAPRLQTNDG